MKRRLKAALALVLCFTVVFSSGWCLGAVSAANATVEYYMDGDKKTGIKAVTTADGLLYYDIADGGLLASGANNVPEFYIKALTAEYDGASTAEMWANIASNIFEDAGAGAGYFCSVPTSTTFDTMFTQDTEKKAGDFNLAEVLGSSSKFETGVANSLTDGYAYATGLQYYSSFESVQREMARTLITAANDSRLTEEDIIKAATGSEDGFEFLKSTTGKPVIAAIATSKENTPADLIPGPPFSFSSFGLAFYDFELIPFAAEGVEFVTAAEGYDTLEDADADNAPGVEYNSTSAGNAFVSYTTNPTRSATNTSVSFSQTNSISVSNSMQSTESHTYGESHGVQVSLGVSIPKLFTKIGGAYSYGTSTQETIATAYGENKSITESITNTSSAQVNLPAHTKIGISQVKSETEVILDYDCPVYITYKVAIFGMNGYALATGPDSMKYMGGMCTTFGAGDTVNGYTACENLYKRSIQYANMPSFEQDQNYFAKTAEGTPPQVVNWSSIIDQTQNNCDHSVRICVEWLNGKIPLSAAGATITMKQSGVETNLMGIEPLYNLSIVTAKSTGAYSLAMGGSMDLIDVGTQGFDQYAVPYYGYLPLKGSWSVCDASGNAVANETGLTIERTNYTQIVTANEIGDYYLKYSIDEETYKDVNDSTKYITNKDLTTFPIIKICVTQTGENHNCTEGDWKTTIPATCFMEGTQVKQCEICGIQMDVRQVEKLAHTPVKVTTPATCTEDGCVTSSCGICGAEISSEVIPATGHNDGVWKVDFEATADHNGQMSRYCTDCGAVLETKEFDLHTHQFGYESITREPTCTANGEKGLFCSICNAMYATEQIEKSGHGATTAAISVQPTCTTDGEEKLYCTDCGMHVGTNTIPATGHDNGVWKVDFEATADHDGQMSRYCSKCNEVLETKAIQKHTHTLGYEKIITPATCTDAGEKCHFCADCDVCYETVTIPATGHDEGVWKVDFEATDDHDGQKTRYCTKCNQALESTSIEKHKHTFGYEQVITPATCTVDGVMGKFCADCNTCYETQAIPAKGHGEKIGTVTVQPTCTIEGQKTFYCTDCGMQTGVETVAALGHDDGVWKVDFEATADHDGQMTRYCSVCNVALESKTFELHEHSYTSWKTNNDGTHSRDCYKCDFTESANCNYVATKTDADCTQGGHTTYVCSYCNHTYVDDHTEALGHSWSEWKECTDGCCHERECIREGCDEKETQDHSWSEWVDNKDGKFFKNGTKTRTCSNCGAEETEEAKHTSTISRFFYPIYVFIGNFVHKIIYLISLNWLFPELTITPKI